MLTGDKTWHPLNPAFQLMKDKTVQQQTHTYKKQNDWFSYWWENMCEKSDENGYKLH